ncbi:MAG TPA: hypothetical protein VNI84_13785 [Pyrinomonadaceae bacterium]|nr:hypothetical protein [Pyrinomonadaceae bacterium]
MILEGQPTHFDNSTFAAWTGSGETRTPFEDLQAALAKFPPPAFSVLTINPAFKERLADELPELPNEHSLSSFRTPSFGDWQVIVLSNQKASAVEWKNKELLDLYLEMMGERETKQVERQAALKMIASTGRMDFSELVLQTIQTPTELLTELIKPVREAFKEFPDLIIDKAVQVKEPVKRRQPFYMKFVR